jgi:site-specific recombinase XerD
MWKNVLISDNHSSRGDEKIVISIPDPKTVMHMSDQKIVCLSDRTITCPIQAIRHMKSGSPHECAPGELLFKWSSGRAVTTKQCQARLRKLCVAVGISLARYSGMSTRRGGALSLAEAGVEDRIIQEMGRWKSNTFRVYIELSDAMRLEAQNRAARDATRNRS